MSDWSCVHTIPLSSHVRNCRKDVIIQYCWKMAKKTVKNVMCIFDAYVPIRDDLYMSLTNPATW